MIWAIKDSSISSTFIDEAAATFFLPHLVPRPSTSPTSAEDDTVKVKPLKRMKYLLDPIGEIGTYSNGWSFITLLILPVVDINSLLCQSIHNHKKHYAACLYIHVHVHVHVTNVYNMYAVHVLLFRLLSNALHRLQLCTYPCICIEKCVPTWMYMYLILMYV